MGKGIIFRALPRARAEMWDSLGKGKGLRKKEQAEKSNGSHLDTPLGTAPGAPRNASN